MKLDIKNILKGKLGPTDMSNKSIEKDLSRIITVLVLPTFLIAFSVVAIRYFWSLKQYNSTVIEISEDALSTAENNIESIESLKSSLFDLGQDGATEVLDALPSKYDYLALPTSIEKIVLQNGLTLGSFSSQDLTGTIEESTANPVPEPITFTLSAQGSYEEVQNLIDSLERSIRPIQITKLNISGEGSAIQLNLDATTYYQLSESLEITTKEVNLTDVGSDIESLDQESIPLVDDPMLDGAAL